MDIQISGLECFSPSHWRDAIKYYLFGVWGNKCIVMYRPKIAFGDVTLRLGQYPDQRYYYAYGNPKEKVPDKFLHPEENDPSILSTSSSAPSDVEVALMRFVLDDAIECVRIRIPCCFGGGEVFLWKDSEKKGELGISAVGIPSELF